MPEAVNNLNNTPSERFSTGITKLSREVIDLEEVPIIISEIIGRNINEEDIALLQGIVTNELDNESQQLVLNRVERALKHDNIPGDVITDKWWLVSKHVVAQSAINRLGQ